MRDLNILFAVDLTDLSLHIAPHVEKLIDVCDGNLHVLFVVSNHSLDATRKNANVDPIKTAKENLKRFINANFKAKPFKVDVVYGNPEEKILNYAMKENINIIIVGGRKTDDGQLHRSQMIQKLIRESRAHVWIFTADGGPIKELRSGLQL